MTLIEVIECLLVGLAAFSPVYRWRPLFGMVSFGRLCVYGDYEKPRHRDLFWSFGRVAEAIRPVALKQF